MQNDPRDLDGKRVAKALSLLGRREDLRQQVIALCLEAESVLEHDGSCREDITGPIVDAMHSEDDVYTKELSDGTRVSYLYRTKIARDLLLAPERNLTHLWEPQTTKLLLHLTESAAGDLIVGGAYFGDQALLAGKRLAPLGLRVHCFEPNDAQAGMLLSNIALNEFKNFTVHKMGLWSSSGKSMRLDGFDSFANVVAAPDGEGFDTITIDDFVSANALKVGLVQLDIEGSELAALQGARNTLSRDMPNVIFELHRSYVDWDNGLRETEICKLFLEMDYQVFAIRDINSHYEMPDHKIELVELDHVYLEGPHHGFNMVAFRPDFEFNDAVFRVMRRVSPKLLPHKDPRLHHPTEGF
ncbi:MAG: FkbM family methyltransferase [Proteobacteria bacterium]|nr:FkbM family methyltransferase [Pseudomonadota bacterium]